MERDINIDALADALIERMRWPAARSDACRFRFPTFIPWPALVGRIYFHHKPASESDMDLPILLGLLYIGYLAYVGKTGGTGSLMAHVFLLWVLLIVGNIAALAWSVVRHW